MQGIGQLRDVSIQRVSDSTRIFVERVHFYTQTASHRPSHHIQSLPIPHPHQLPLPLGLHPHRYRALPVLPSVPPPENSPKHKHHDVDPQNLKPKLPTNRDFAVSVLPVIAHLHEPLRIVRDDSVRLARDAPFHERFFVDGPHDDGATEGAGVAQELGADEGGHEGLLEQVEGDVGGREELASVGDGKADVAHGEGREVGVAEGDVFCLEKVRSRLFGWLRK